MFQNATNFSKLRAKTGDIQNTS